MPDTHPSVPWGDHDLPEPGADHTFAFGPLKVRVRRVKNELWVASRRDAAEGSAGHRERMPADDDPEWSRWALPDQDARLRFTPALPDRMLVVKVEQPFTLLSHATARIYTRVGASVRVQVAGSRGALDLTEIPVERLSDTWWGDFQSGEYALWLATRARRDLTDVRIEPWQIVCTLELVNTSSDSLPVEKLALRVEHLPVFRTGGQLWAGEVRVEYLGADQGSEIEPTGRPPAEAGEAERVAPARVPSMGFRARTFAKLKSLSPFGVGG